VSRVAFVDVIGGAAGDMLLAALLDAGAPEAEVLAAVERVVPGRFVVRTEEVRRAGLRARFLRVEPDSSFASDGARSRSIEDLIASVERVDLVAAVRDAAVAVLRRLGEAEARVHGVAGDGGSLHELGDDDTLLDVVGVAAAMHALGVERLLVSSVPLTVGGVVAGAEGHAGLPLPAPATVELLRGFDLRIAPPDAGETVTPTAAAIFAALGSPSNGVPELRLTATGYGAGARDPEGYPNVVRVLIGEVADATATEGFRERPLVVLEANIDDLTPELAADAADALARAGALDVWITPVHMKKGRPGMILSALAEPSSEARLRRVFFETTTTFGVRSSLVRRAELERTVEAVDLPDGGRVRIKVGWLGGRVISATPEHDDVAAVARQAGLTVRQVYSEAVAAARSLLGTGAER